MLPGVNTEEGLVLADNRVLVLIKKLALSSFLFTIILSGSTYGVCADANLASLLVLDEPSPAASLDTSESSVHLVLELVKAAVGAVDGLGQSTRWGLTTASLAGGQVLPEESVVQVTTTVEVDGRLEGNLGGDVLLGLSLLELLKRSVVVVDVGLVVGLVVNLHDLTGDRGLQSAIVVCNGGC